MTTEVVDTWIQSIEPRLKAIEAQIQGIAAQLERLQAQVVRLRLSLPLNSLGDLEGILAGYSDFSEEEIDAALYRFEWEGESSDDMR